MPTVPRFFSSLALLLFCALVFFPVGAFLLDSLSLAQWGSINENFLRLFALSLFHTSLHVLLTLFLLGFLALFFTLASLARPKIFERFSGLIDYTALFFFVLPGVSAAALYLSVSSEGVLPNEGVVPIALTHLMLNLALVSRSCQLRVWSALNGNLREAHDQLELSGVPYSKLVGALVLPVFWKELRAWIPLLAIWCVFSFPVVLILGGRPVFSTPEVLLFFSLSSAQQSARVLFLFIFSFFLSLLFFRFFSRRELTADSVARSGFDLYFSSLKRPPFVLHRAIDIVCICFFLLLVMGVGKVLFEGLTSGVPGEGFWLAVGGSTLLAFLASLVFLLFFLFSMLTGPRIRMLYCSLAGVSGTLLLAAWLVVVPTSLPLEWRLILVAVAVNLAFAPLMFRWVESRKRGVQKEIVESAKLFGLSPLSTMRYVYWPHCRSLFFRGLVLVFLWAFGELAFSSFYLEDMPLLSVFARQQAQRYSFGELSWVMFVSAAFCLALLAPLSKLEGKRHGAEF